MGRIKSIELYSCCLRRPITVEVDLSTLHGEAWRIARLLKTSWFRRRDNGIRVMSNYTNLQLANDAGWPAERIRNVFRVYGTKWSDRHPLIDWNFNGLHWTSHKNRPVSVPDAEILNRIVIDWFNEEAKRIVRSEGTAYYSGDYSVKIEPNVYDESGVLWRSEQSEAETQRAWRAMFGGEG